MKIGKNSRAFMLIELAVAGVVLMGAMVFTLQMLGWTASQRRLAERRGRALQEAANAMERLTALPWDALSSENSRKIAKLSGDAAEVLRDGKMEVEIEEVKVANAIMKRIRLSLRWRGASGAAEAPVRLAAWVAPREARP